LPNGFMIVSHKTYDSNTIANDILLSVEDTIATYNMFQRGDSVLVGVSGGPDSVALLHILTSLSSELSIRLGVAHLNHCLRQEDSDRDAVFVASLSRKLGLPCFIGKEDVFAIQQRKKQSLEDTARQIRYAFFQQIADEKGFGKIATGHHQEDNAEVVLMDIFRGCGSKGISGIPPVRDGRIVRPLIGIPQSKIYEFLDEKGLPYRIDASNQDMRYLRNKVRHQLIPILKSSYNPQIIETLDRLSIIARSDESWIDDIIDSLFKNALLSEKEKGCITLSAAAVNAQHVAAQRRLIRRAISQVKGDLKRIRLSHVESIIRLLKKRPAYGRLDLPDRIWVNLIEDQLVFVKEKKPLRHIAPNRNLEKLSFSYPIEGPGRLTLPSIGLSLVFSIIPLHQLPERFPPGHQVVFMDMDKLRFPITVRNIRAGDRFVPLGMKDSQKVKTYFINQKIPRSARATCLVVVNQDERIVWVVNHRLDDAFRITSSTQNVIKGELFLA